MSIERQLIVFDFDWYVFYFILFLTTQALFEKKEYSVYPRSMADQDTDRWVFEVLAPDLRRQMKNLKDKIQWTDLVYVFLLCLELFSETKNTALNHSVRLIPVELHANKSKTVFVSCHLSVPFLPPFSSLSKKNSSTPLLVLARWKGFLKP